jgi:hypothetical protein
MFYGLVEEIANGGAKWSGQDKGRPEQQDSRHIRPKIKRGEHCQSRAEYERSASVAEARVRDPIPKGSPEGLGKCNRPPVERFNLWRADGRDRYGAERPILQTEHCHETGKQDQ